MRTDRSIVKTSAEARAEFYDCDPMGVVWHGNYPRFFEIGRCALLDLIDYGYARMSESGYAWPVVDMGLKYIQPVRFRQNITVETALTEWENRLKFVFEIRDAETRKRVTRGYTVHVAVDIKTEQMLWETPPILREKLKAYL